MVVLASIAWAAGFPVLPTSRLRTGCAVGRSQRCGDFRVGAGAFAYGWVA
jgi:hypothetical protein